MPYTPLGLTLQETGANVNVWGEVNNDEVVELIDEAIRGRAAFALTGTVTLTATSGVTNQARCMLLHATSGSGGTVVIPAISKLYIAWNQSTGDMVISTGGATTTTLETGDLTVIFCDGDKVRQIMVAGYTVREYIEAATLSEVELPAQTGNAGKFIKTDGTNATWEDIQGSDLNNWTADAAAVRTGTATDKGMTPGDTYNGLAEVTVTSSGNSVALNFASGINFYHDLTENTTLANPTNAKVGQTGWIRVRQHASSAKTCATGSNWYRVGGDLAVDTTLSSYNIYEYQVIATDYILYDLLRNPSNT